MNNFEFHQAHTAPICEEKRMLGRAIVRSRWLVSVLLAGLLTAGMLLRSSTSSAAPPMPGTTILGNTFTVTSEDDLEGTCTFASCTLRQAINGANANPGLDTIAFNIPGAGVHTITLGSTVPLALPTIADPVIIDGYTQPGSSPNTQHDGDNGKRLIALTGPDLPQFLSALEVSAGNSTIRGLVIHDVNTGNGIRLKSHGGNRIEGNDLHDLAVGVYVEAPANQIGGLSAAARNLLSNDESGVMISGPDSTGNFVRGNFIGTDRTGTSPRANCDGILLMAPRNTIGGRTRAARNLISGNKCHGILFKGSDASHNRVRGNLIGSDITGSLPLGNWRSGIWIEGGEGNRIGGLRVSTGNTIAFNGKAIEIGDGSGNSILSNRIFSNSQSAIDLNFDGVTPNDYGRPPDSDSGPNNLQNYPVLGDATSAGSSTAIGGVLQSTPSTSFHIQLFRSPECDSSGYGEGHTALRTFTVQTDANGNAAFAIDLGTIIPPDTFITATATDIRGNTSEFSRCVSVH